MHTITGRFSAKYFYMLMLATIHASHVVCAIEVELSTREAVNQPADIEAFVREGCPHCSKAKEFLATLNLQRPGYGGTGRVPVVVY